MMTARMLSSFLIRVSASDSSRLSARSSAFRTRGRLSVMTTTLSARSQTMLAYMTDPLRNRSPPTLARVALGAVDRRRVQEVDRVGHVEALKLDLARASLGRVHETVREARGQPHGERHGRQRGVSEPAGRKHRAAGHEEVRDTVDATVRCHDSAPRVVVHPRRSHVVVGVWIRGGIGIEQHHSPYPSALELAGDDRADPGQMVAVEIAPAPVDFGLGHVESIAIGPERDPVFAIGGLLEIDYELDGVVTAARPPPEPSRAGPQRD